MSLDMNRCWFIDVDGTIVEHQSDFKLLDALFNKDWKLDKILPGVAHLWDNIPEQDYIVITTARPSIFRYMTEKALKRHGLRFDYILMNLPSGPRILVNDTKPENEGGMTTAHAIPVERNKGLAWEDFEEYFSSEGTDTI
ncbi:hypothetical protein CMI47_16205 [Candidatus Pacearchaeota archaeon]|nr:hypothetical protein [Candidatus Pacearchaeota archaeon]|tara:strand:- start:1638 stop:2057 length:420 start_codon:yes stop_codon:yes gene_type:complete